MPDRDIRQRIYRLCAMMGDFAQGLYEEAQQMINAFDRIVVAVPDLATAVDDYQRLLGANFWRLPGAPPQARAWLGLANVVLELCEQAVERATIVGLVFAGDVPAGTQTDVNNARQLALSICDGDETARFRREQPAAQNLELQVDHLVLRTADADDCVNLFSVGLGIRLALDRDAPRWGGRMLFFRVGKLTLEVIEPAEDKPEHDYFWGIAYQCSDITTTAATLRQCGVELSEVRDGRKPGTKVATIKSHALAIPTLLIEPANRV